MGSCVIYKTKKKYKIVTESLAKIRLLIGGEPIHILEIEENHLVLWSRIIDSLKSSRIDVEIPKRDEWGKWEKENLKMMQETSFTKLYKESTSCQIRIDNNNLRLVRYVYEPKYKGLVEDEANIYEYLFDEANWEKYIDKLVELLNM